MNGGEWMKEQIILKRLYIKNFTSIDEIELFFDQDDKFIIVNGINKDLSSLNNSSSNGTGKSSIIK